MPFGDDIPDKTILNNVNKKLVQAGGGSQSKITVTVRNGNVTLTGTLRFELHRRSIVKSAGSVDGVRRVFDNLKVEPPKKHWG